jgi:hypothetical protein
MFVSVREEGGGAVRREDDGVDDDDPSVRACLPGGPSRSACSLGCVWGCGLALVKQIERDRERESE